MPSTVVAIGVGLGVFTDAALLIFSDSIGGHGNDSTVGVGTFYKDKFYENKFERTKLCKTIRDLFDINLP